MAELKRKDEQLTTADLAGRTEQQQKAARDVREAETRDAAEGAGPRLVRNDNPELRNQPATTVGAPTNAPATTSTPLFSQSDIGDLRGRWSNVQTGFVDEPRRAVEEADKLVATVMQRLAEGFARERDTLEKQWDRGDNVSTEDLRIALQRYRSFFDRLLNA